MSSKSGGGLYSKTITRKYEDDGTGEVPGRPAGFIVGSTSEYEVTYGYDNVGRLARISDGPGLPAYGAVYTRLANSELVEYLKYNSAETTTLATTQRHYETARDLIDYVQNDASANPPGMVSKYQYRNDALGRRRDVVYTGAAFDQDHMFKWGYNTRSELETADRHEGTTPDNPGDLMMLGDYDYRYDHIGNRTSYRLDVDPATTYTPNNLNQPLTRRHPRGGCGREATARPCLGRRVKGQYTSTANPTEYLCYDNDGNLTQDGKATANCETADGAYAYTWDGENRLIGVAPVTPGTDAKRLTLTYDYMSRRVRKVVETYSGSTWSQTQDLRFVYDGWNVVEVLNGLASNQVVKKYTWGLDLSGQAGNSTTAGIHGAGGIGGLLAVEEPQTVGDSKRYWFFYDANGNVGQVIQNTTGYPVVAHYEYDPYGNIIVASGAYAAANPIRFSTKWLDTETGLYYYIYRYYLPRIGRWGSRDPIEERGGKNLLTFVANAPLSAVDPVGKASSPPCRCPTGTCDAWRVRVITSGAGGVGVGVVGLNADLTPAPHCAISPSTARPYKFLGAGLAVGLDLSGGLSLSEAWFTTPCVRWEDHNGGGRVTTVGLGLVATYSIMFLDMPQGYVALGGCGWGIEGGGGSVIGHWGLQ